MAKKFECAGSTYTIDEAINGQTPLTFYDTLAQVAMRPSLREGTVLCYWQTGIAGLISQIQSLLHPDNRVVKANPYWWTEYCQQETIAVKVKKHAGPAANQITVTLGEGSHGITGKFSKVRAGYRAYIKELKGQGCNITAVNKATNGAHTVTIKGLNSEILDLTKFSTYTLLVDSLRMYVKGDLNPISKHGLTSNPPILRKGYVQKFEDGINIHEDEIDGYAYDQEFYVVKGLSPLTGKPIDMWYIPQINEQLEAMVMDNININTLFGIRDDAAQQGYDGLITTADQQGSDSTGYDVSAGASLRQILFNKIKALRKLAGCTDQIIAHDFGFNQDWSEAMASMAKEFAQNHIYSLFGSGGEGARNFKYFEFKDFEAYGYYFRSFMIDAFDHLRYGNFLEDFALVLPSCQFRDTNNKVVPPVTYVNIEGSEPAKINNMWVDDARKRGGRTVDFYVKHSSGMEIHCASKLSTMRKRRC
jgi:hypothetical protein